MRAAVAVDDLCDGLLEKAVYAVDDPGGCRLEKGVL